MNPRDHVILYVDDERPNRVVFEHTFSDVFDIKTVDSGAAALEVMAAGPIAVLITDQRMPGMAGHELLARVREAYPDTVRITITAYSDLDPILRAVNEGLVARYVIKPWDRAEVEQMLHWALQAHVLGRDDSALQLRLMQTERLATLGSISAALIHDLTGPLSSMSHNAQRLGQLARAAEAIEAASPGGSGPLRDLASELAEIADESGKSCTLMLQMSDGIKQFGRPSSPVDRPVCAPVVVVRQALALSRDVALRRRARLVYDGPDELPEARIAGVELTQILLNLVINATQAIERTGQAGRVLVTAEMAGDRIDLSVADDGAGMSEDTLRRVGTPFFTTREDGSGLGLAQCMRLAGRAGAELSIDSTLGQGTRITLRLPRA